MDVTDSACNLECVKDGAVREFVGPVKIILMDPPENLYNKKRVGAALLALTNLTLGASNILILFFTLTFVLELYTNLHVLLCTVGFQLCIPSGILMLNPLNGASGPLKKFERKWQHTFLQAFGLACGVSGTLLVILLGKYRLKKKETIHYYAGLVACGAGCAAGLLGPVAFFFNPRSVWLRTFASMHRISGLIAFVASTVCFFFAVIKPEFTTFFAAAPEMHYTLFVFGAFYTFVVISNPIVKFASGSYSDELH